MNTSSIKIKIIVYIVTLTLGGFFHSQIRVSGSIPNPNDPNSGNLVDPAVNSSAFIDASSNPEYNQSTNLGKGLLFPRVKLDLLTAFSQGPFGPGTNYPSYYDGFVVYNESNSGVAGIGDTEGTLCRGFWYYENPSTSSLTSGTWRPMRPGLCSSPIVTTLDCSSTANGRVDTGTLTQGTLASGVSSDIPYLGGNGSNYPIGTGIASTGVTGLTATLQAGTLANGNGTLRYVITGTPSSSGTATFTISFGGQSCSFTRTVDTSGPIITTLDCSSTANGRVDTGTLTQGTLASGVSSDIPYLGGNGVNYPAGAGISSTGVTGLTATLQAGILANGNGTLRYVITGTPSSSGTATFTISFGGQGCSFTRIVASNTEVVMCGKTWKAHNLGANESLDPNVPVAGIHGDKYQWGRINPILTQTQDQANAGPVTWNFNDASDGSWGPSRTSNDPCPQGFRVPTQAEWQALNSCSSVGRIGPFGDDASLFSSALTYTSGSNKLTFPAAGFRSHLSIPNNPTLGGVLQMRNEVGMYWSSTSYYTTQNNPAAYSFGFNSSSVNPSSNAGYRIEGHSVRCIAE
ncbi:hypothetical protein D1632_01875 [Chryseobacterium nematophagum]|uniref:Uncharacterized protein n=1 Tax=Chryseobacterium nematophagum TaxID=2305228 RepID=A0A3M7LGT1_9FLAO|nr:FISUMP domain-containing protein [Chryseobacterium nematophagum]RMZ60752.1 hypothetical protein D1632_01875 [Chryseobacterium nematophagum]